MKRGKAKVFLTLLVILIAGIYYYVTIPAVNIHASGFWTSILTVIILLLAAYGIKMRFTSFQEAKKQQSAQNWRNPVGGIGDYFCSRKHFVLTDCKCEKNIGIFLQSKNASFSKDIQPVNFSQIPLLDKDSAAILGKQ